MRDDGEGKMTRDRESGIHGTAGRQGGSDRGGGIEGEEEEKIR